MTALISNPKGTDITPSVHACALGRVHLQVIFGQPKAWKNTAVARLIPCHFQDALASVGKRSRTATQRERSNQRFARSIPPLLLAQSLPWSPEREHLCRRHNAR